MVLVSTVHTPQAEPAQVLIQSMHPGSPSAATTMLPPWLNAGGGVVIAVVVGGGFVDPPEQALTSDTSRAPVQIPTQPCRPLSRTPASNECDRNVTRRHQAPPGRRRWERDPRRGPTSAARSDPPAWSLPQMHAPGGNRGTHP